MMYSLSCYCVLGLLSSLVSGIALPANIDLRQPTQPPTDNDNSLSACSDVECVEGSATLNRATGVCVCPQWAGQNPDDPCEVLTCPEATQVHYSKTTNQCLCKLKHIAPVLVQDTTDETPEQNALVYSALPYFPDGVITYMFQTSGGSWTLNASTTIAADGIGTAPQPNLVLVPKYMMSRPAKPVTKTALIIAVILNDNETITYHVQLSDGRVVKLYGDQYVHNIDRMDPTQPPGLSLVTSPTMHHLKRDVLDRYEEADSQIQASSAQLTKRGVEDVSAYSATVSAETCASITCLNNGGKPAQYNPFLNSCYCQTLVPLELSPIAKVKRSAPEADEDALRRDMHDSSKIPPFWGNRPSARTCRYMLSCPGESTPYFDEATSQCLCVVYRKGFEEPVIASDTKMLPRAAAEETTEGEEDVERKQIPYDPGFNPAGSPFQFCTEDRVWYCNREHGSYAAWDPRIQAWCWCYQKPLWPADKELPPLAE